MAADAVFDAAGCCWEEEFDVRLVLADEVPLDEAEAVGAEGVRVLVEVFFAFCWGMDFSLLGLRVEPTSLRKREFMDDIQRGAFLAVAWRGRGEERIRGRRAWREARSEQAREEESLGWDALQVRSERRSCHADQAGTVGVGGGGGGGADCSSD